MKAILTAACCVVLGLGLISASPAFAMSRPLPKAIQDEWMRDTRVQTDFNLRATDGSIISLRTSKTVSAGGLKYLPAEKGADRSKCGKNDIDITIALSEVTLNLVKTGQLSASDIRALQKTPRCEPYLDLLGNIGNILDRSSSSDGETPDKLSVIKIEKGYALQLKMKSGRLALFRIAAKLDGVKSVKDLERIRLDASTTGQNVGLSFNVTDRSTSEPTRSRSHEACTVYETIRGKTVARPGHRRTISQTSITSYNIEMSFLAPNGQLLMKSSLSDADFDTDKREGTCYPD